MTTLLTTDNFETVHFPVTAGLSCKSEKDSCWLIADPLLVKFTFHDARKQFLPDAVCNDCFSNFCVNRVECTTSKELFLTTYYCIHL